MIPGLSACAAVPSPDAGLPRLAGEGRLQNHRGWLRRPAVSHARVENIRGLDVDVVRPVPCADFCRCRLRHCHQYTERVVEFEEELVFVADRVEET